VLYRRYCNGVYTGVHGLVSFFLLYLTLLHLSN